MKGISPGVRKLVRWLNIHGFNTTDSGDGSNHANGMECAVEFPHVFMTVDPKKMLEESHRLLELFSFVDSDLEELEIQVSYSPVDRHSILMLMGVTDDDIFP